MWVSLADENLVEIYKQGFSPDKVPEAIVELLKQLAQKPYAKKLSAVTSLGQLYITTAHSWNDTERNHSIHIHQENDAGKTVVTISSETESSKKSVISRQCSIDEAADYIDLYVLSILLKKYEKL
jgi:hypothetical protein